MEKKVERKKKEKRDLEFGVFSVEFFVESLHFWELGFCNFWTDREGAFQNFQSLDLNVSRGVSVFLTLKNKNVTGRFLVSNGLKQIK